MQRRVGDHAVEGGLEVERLPVGDPRIEPAGPGLGVELDEDQLERFRDRSGRATPLG